MKNLKIPVYFYAVAAMLFWGMSFIWTSILLISYQPVSIIFFRLILSTAFLFFLKRILKIREKIDRDDWLLLFLSALFTPFLYFLGENYGLKYSTSTITAVVIGTIPLFSPVIAWYFFKEKLSWMNLTGIFISFIGIVLIIISKDFSLAVNPLGILILFGAVLSALLYSVLLRRLSFRYSPLILIYYQNFVGIFLFLPIFIFLDFTSFIKVAPDGRMIISFLCLSIFASSLSFVFYAKTMKEIGISRANIFSNLIPVFTAVFSYLILSEVFTLQKIAGIIIVVSGVFLTSWHKRKPGFS